MKMILWLMALSNVANVYAVVDRKCYVELANDTYVVIQGTIKDSQGAEIVFQKKGFELNGQLLMVKRVIECQPTEQPFNLEAAQRQEKLQPR
ncbi:TPA: type IVa secretion system protein TapY2 [Aeromonas veronii]